MIRDRFLRTRLLLGDESLSRLAGSRVLVIGLGAVGSYAVEGLARAGVGTLRLVDFDRVELTNVNRQLYALESTLGQRKAELAAHRVTDINPACRVEPVVRFAHDDTLPELLEPRPDVVIDAIDTLNAKVAVMAACVTAGIPIISSMGAARRTDPLRLHVADISRTYHCPLARFVRKRLHKRGIRSGVRCVFSTEPVPDLVEPPPETLAPSPPDAAADAPPNGRPRRVMGSFACVTGVMGLVVAAEAIKLLISAPPTPRPFAEGGS